GPRLGLSCSLRRILPWRHAGPAGGTPHLADAAGKHIDTIALPPLAPGIAWQLEPRFWRGGDGPHVHIQAAVHADEIPPLLLAHVLERRFDALAARGSIRGTISLLPFANPLGLSQFVGG